MSKCLSLYVGWFHNYLQQGNHLKLLLPSRHRGIELIQEGSELLAVFVYTVTTKYQKGINQHYAPLRTLVDINVIFLPFFFLFIAVGVARLELLGSRLLAST